MTKIDIIDELKEWVRTPHVRRFAGHCILSLLVISSSVMYISALMILSALLHLIWTIREGG